MSDGGFLLWGCDGELKGNEHRLQWRLPLFTRDGDETVYAARRLDWSPALLDSDVLRFPVERARDYGERLELASPMNVVSGQYVVLLGPELIDNMKRSITGVAMPHRTTESGFGVLLMRQEELNAYMRAIEERAREDFDFALRQHILPVAAAANAVMRNAGGGDLRPQIIRTLALHWVIGDADAYRRTLRLGEVRLRDNAEQLKSEMLEHLDFIRAERSYPLQWMRLANLKRHSAQRNVSGQKRWRRRVRN